MTDFASTWRDWASRPSVILACLFAGAAAGLLAPGPSAHISIVSEIYVDLLKMVILPFMVSAVIFSLRRLMREGGASAILGRVLLIFVIAMIATAVIGLISALVVSPGRGLPPDTLVTLGKLVGDDLARGGHMEIPLFALPEPAKTAGIGDMLMSIIPNNIFAALTQGDTLKSLVFSLLFGLAIGRVPGAASETLTNTLQTVYDTCLKLTHWFNYLLPFVLFSMIASQTAKTGLEPLRAMFGFLVTLGVGSLLIVALSLVALRAATGKTWREVLRSQREPLAMAVATRSSPACMPSMIESLVDRLGLPRLQVELLVPLGVSLLRLGPVLYYVVATFFIAHLYERDLQAAEVLIILAGAILAGFASSGMTGFITISLTGIVCAYVGLPFEAALALFVAIDPICDILRTVVLVATNNAFAALACTRGSPQTETTSC